MAFDIVDPEEFLNDGLFSQDSFLERVAQHDWNAHRDKQVLIKGCTSGVIPPWAFMILTGKLAGVARTVRFGNEHDHILVYRSKKN